MERQKKATLLAQIGLSISCICGAISLYAGIQLFETGLYMFREDLAYFMAITGGFICLCTVLAAVLMAFKKYKAAMIATLMMCIPCLVMIFLAATIAMVAAGIAGIFAAVMMRDALQAQRSRLAMSRI